MLEGGAIERCGLCKDIISQVGGVTAESEWQGGEAPDACVHCTGGCGRKVHAECARRLSLAGGSAADDTAARRGRGARPAAAPAALSPPPPPAPPDPPDPPAVAPGLDGKGSQDGKHKLDGGYWSAALPAGKRSAAARSAAAEACFEAAARGASAGPKRDRGPATAKAEAEAEADLEAAMASAAGPWAATASAGAGGGGWAAAAAGAAAVAAEALAAEAPGWRCGRCAALLGRAVYARAVDGFYHRGVAVARDQHGQMQAERPWYMHGICMVYAWYMHGICMVYAWYMHGICMVDAW